MIVTYDIIHILRDKTERLIKTVKDPTEIKRITEEPRYLGTWIRPDKKLLRWNMGELVIRRNEYTMKITGQEVAYMGPLPVYKLHVAYSERVKSFIIGPYTITAYDINNDPLWGVINFAELAEVLDNKEIAYQVQQYYEAYLEQFNIKGAM